MLALASGATSVCPFPLGDVVVISSCADTPDSAAGIDASPGNAGFVYRVQCDVSDCAEPVSGCSPYTTNSSICSSARQWGWDDGVVFDLTIAAGEAGYTGCDQGGVVSGDSNAAAASFTVGPSAGRCCIA